MPSLRPITIQGTVVATIAKAAGQLGRMTATERDRWPLWLPVCFGVGVGVYFALLREPPIWLGASGALAAVLVAWFGQRRPGLVLLAIVFGTMALGLATAQFRAVWVSAPVLEKRAGPVQLTGRVVATERLESGHRIVLDSVVIRHRPRDRTPSRIRVKAYKVPPELHPGDQVSTLAILAPPPAPATPGGFDFSRRAYFERLGGVGFTVAPVRMVQRDSGDGPLGA